MTRGAELVSGGLSLSSSHKYFLNIIKMVFWKDQTRGESRSLRRGCEKSVPSSMGLITPCPLGYFNNQVIRERPRMHRGRWTLIWLSPNITALLFHHGVSL